MSRRRPPGAGVHPQVRPWSRRFEGSAARSARPIGRADLVLFGRGQTGRPGGPRGKSLRVATDTAFCTAALWQMGNRGARSEASVRARCPKAGAVEEDARAVNSALEREAVIEFTTFNRSPAWPQPGTPLGQRRRDLQAVVRMAPECGLSVRSKPPHCYKLSAAICETPHQAERVPRAGAVSCRFAPGRGWAGRVDVCVAMVQGVPEVCCLRSRMAPQLVETMVTLAGRRSASHARGQWRVALQAVPGSARPLGGGSCLLNRLSATRGDPCIAHEPPRPR